MGRFFPYADLTDIVRNMKAPDNASYNATFTYPEGGAIEYVKAIASAVRPGAIALGERARRGRPRAQGRARRTATREIRFERLVSSAPFNRFAAMCGLDHDPATWAWNKVLVFNLGFDAQGPDGRALGLLPVARRPSFYRVGWYDNIFDTDRLSLYVEIGFPKDATIDVRGRRASGCSPTSKREGVVTEPAARRRALGRARPGLRPHHASGRWPSTSGWRRSSRSRGVWSLGRYGGWTYCAIEDNIVEARAARGELAIVAAGVS